MIRVHNAAHAREHSPAPQPGKDAAPELAGGRGSEVENGCDEGALAADAAAAKRLSTLRAELALAAFEVRDLQAGWMVMRWGTSKIVSDLDELAEFARRAGVRA